MQRNIIIRYFFISVILFSLVACAKSDDNETMTIGIANFVSHPALNAIEAGFIDVFQNYHPDAQFQKENANGETLAINNIAQQFKLSSPDLVLAITTPVAQGISNQITDIPVVFAGVTDPIGAGLVTSLEHGENNITGVADIPNLDLSLKTLKTLVDFETIGIVYTSSEANGVIIAEGLKEYAAENGFKVEATAVTNSSEVKQAVESLVSSVDVFYIGTDNTVVSAISSYGEVAAKYNKPIFSTDLTSAKEGKVLLAMGLDYYKQGQNAAQLAQFIVSGTPPAELAIKHPTEANEYEIYLNADIADSLGITIPSELKIKAKTIISKQS